MLAGRIDTRRAKVIGSATDHLPDPSARAVVDAIIDDAGRLTTGQLHARLEKLCIQVDPEHAKTQYEYAVADRRVVVEPSGDGTAHLLGLDLAPHRVAAVSRRINQMALNLNQNGETRSMDQLRADIYLDLLAGTNHHTTTGAGRGVVDIQVPLDTLTRLAEAPGDLAGYGPVIADIARQVTETQEDAEWRYTITDPDTGLSIQTGTTRRRPTTSQRRQVEARDRTCVFPGCRMPAADCDLDHRTPWAEGGPTSMNNLTPLCRHDHRIRHQAGWTHHALPNGDHEWTTKLGHTHTTSGTPPQPPRGGSIRW